MTPSQRLASNAQRRTRRKNANERAKIAAGKKASYERHKHKRKSPEFLAHTRELFLQREYGITTADYDAMNQAQNGLCGICSSPNRPSRRWGNSYERLAVDHNHETGQVRGLLCHNCNVAIAHFKESKILMLNAIDYLDTYNSGERLK